MVGSCVLTSHHTSTRVDRQQHQCQQPAFILPQLLAASGAACAARLEPSPAVTSFRHSSRPASPDGPMAPTPIHHPHRLLPPVCQTFLADAARLSVPLEQRAALLAALLLLVMCAASTGTGCRSRGLAWRHRRTPWRACPLLTPSPLLHDQATGSPKLAQLVHCACTVVTSGDQNFVCASFILLGACMRVAALHRVHVPSVSGCCIRIRICCTGSAASRK